MAKDNGRGRSVELEENGSDPWKALYWFHIISFRSTDIGGKPNGTQTSKTDDECHTSHYVGGFDCGLNENDDDQFIKWISLIVYVTSTPSQSFSRWFSCFMIVFILRIQIAPTMMISSFNGDARWQWSVIDVTLTMSLIWKKSVSKRNECFLLRSFGWIRSTIEPITNNGNGTNAQSIFPNLSRCGNQTPDEKRINMCCAALSRMHNAQCQSMRFNAIRNHYVHFVLLLSINISVWGSLRAITSSTIRSTSTFEPKCNYLIKAHQIWI